METLIIAFIIGGVLLLGEYLLCTKFQNPLWGGIIPVILLIGTIVILASGRIPLEVSKVFPFVVINILFFGDWATGRETYKKMQQEELDKMKVKDID